MAGGKNATSTGGAGEKVTHMELASHGFEIVSWGDWTKEVNRRKKWDRDMEEHGYTQLKHPPREFSSRLCVTGYKHEAVSGHENSKADSILLLDGVPSYYIEVKRQNSQGSTAAKLAYAVLAARYNPFHIPAILVITGIQFLDEEQNKDGSERSYYLFAKKLAEEKVRLVLNNSERGNYEPTQPSSVEIMTGDEFTNWVTRMFRVKGAMMP